MSHQYKIMRHRNCSYLKIVRADGCTFYCKIRPHLACNRCGCVIKRKGGIQFEEGSKSGYLFLWMSAMRCAVDQLGLDYSTEHTITGLLLHEPAPYL